MSGTWKNPHATWEYHVVLKHTPTGETRTIRVDGFGTGPVDERLHGAEWMWTEGNYSCDCNRTLFFYDWERDESECGETKFELIDLLYQSKSFANQSPED